MRQNFLIAWLRRSPSFGLMRLVCFSTIISLPFVSLPFASSVVAIAQSPYPATQYQGFGGGDFATSLPLQADAPGQSAYREMSPDSWAPENGVMNVPSSPASPTLYSVSGSPISVRGRQFSASENLPNNGFQPTGLPAAQRNVNPFVQSSQLSQTGESTILDSKVPSQSTPRAFLQSTPNIPDNIRYPLNGMPVSARSKSVPSQLPSSQLPASQLPATGNSFPTLNPPADFPAGSEPPANSIIRVPENPASVLSGNQFHPDVVLDSTARLDGTAKTWHDAVPAPPNQPWLYPDSRIMQSQNLAGGSPAFRTDLGHRDAKKTVRNHGSPDLGEAFDFENKKKEYPPMSEILATGRYFGSATMMYLRPSFQSNTAITETNSGISSTFDFDYEAAPQFQIGFESKYGPGIEFNYWQYDESSNGASFTGNGTEVGTTTVWGTAPNLTSSLSATTNGETLNAEHALDIETFGASFFKSVQLPISRINGKFGWQYVSIAHDMNALLTDSGGSQIGRLNSRSDMRAVGPTFRLEYFRPVGHTKLELTTGFGGSVLFGRQDHFVNNSVTGNFSRVGADEILTTLDFNAGVQYRKMVAEKRYLFARAGFVYQNWLGGGNALLPSEDFGLRGFTFTVGYNR
jgi:hypothetical protein